MNFYKSYVCFRRYGKLYSDPDPSMPSEATTPNGFAAIKLSGLGKPELLERVSNALVDIFDYTNTVFVNQNHSLSTSRLCTPSPRAALYAQTKMSAAC